MGFVQSRSLSSGATGTSNIPVTFSSNNAAGNLLVAAGRMVTSNLENVGLGIVDTQGNVWTILQTLNILNIQAFVAYATNCKAGPNTVHFTCDTTGGQTFNVVSNIICEYSGFGIPGQVSTLATGAGVTVMPNAITTNRNGELIVFFVENENFGPITPTSFTAGFNQREPGLNASLFDTVQSSAGLIQPSAIYGVSLIWNTFQSSFLPLDANYLYSVPDDRNYSVFPNLPLNVQATLTYIIPAHPSHSNEIDSRAAGAPVDSRAVAFIPENSRTPGTFGPGE